MSYEKYYEGGWQSGESGGTPITPEALNHMEEGIEDALPLDGTVAMTGNLPMGNHRVTEVGAPAADGDAVNRKYVQENFRPSSWTPTAADVVAKAAGAVESIATGGTGEKTFQKALAALSKPQTGDWRTAEPGISAWYYESADATAYNLPFTHCIVLVIKRGANRGTAIAFGWNVGAYHMWRSVLHDDAGTNNWSNWVDACNAIGAEPADTYNNKKVHKKVINMGAIANGDTKVATGINYNQVIRWSGVACNAAGGATICLPYNNTDGTNIRCLMVLDEFIISANTAAYANYNAEITIWYTD